MTSEPIYCAACKFAEYHPRDKDVPANWKCTSPNNLSTDISIVTGLALYFHECCGHARQLEDVTTLPTCGLEARWFEPLTVYLYSMHRPQDPPIVIKQRRSFEIGKDL